MPGFTGRVRLKQPSAGLLSEILFWLAGLFFFVPPVTSILLLMG